jgi:nicotinamidase-related amidase
MIKAEASAFGPSTLAPDLRARGVEWVVVAGVWTEACVDATVRDAVKLGFRVLLVKDACGSGTAAMHQTAIINLANRLYGGAVVDTDAACRLLKGETIDAWQVEGAVPLRFAAENIGEIYAAL